MKQIRCSLFFAGVVSSVRGFFIPALQKTLREPPAVRKAPVTKRGLTRHAVVFLVFSGLGFLQHPL